MLIELLKPESELKSVSSGKTLQMRSTLYAKELKRVDEWQNSFVRDELSQKNILKNRVHWDQLNQTPTYK